MSDQRDHKTDLDYDIAGEVSIERANGANDCVHGNPPFSSHDNLAKRQLALAPPADPMAGDLLDRKGTEEMRRDRTETGHRRWLPVLFQSQRALAESKTRRSVPAKRAAIYL